MLYPFLKRLERDGLIKSKWRLSDKGPLRKYYTLTKQGLAELESEKCQWLKVHSALTCSGRPWPRGVDEERGTCTCTCPLS